MEKESIRRFAWAWRERTVNPTEDHFELRYDSVSDSGARDSVAVARGERPIDHVSGVEFWVNRSSPCSAAMNGCRISELDFYLALLGERGPWAYARYHCGTSSNVYSDIHWSLCAG